MEMFTPATTHKRPLAQIFSIALTLGVFYAMAIRKLQIIYFLLAQLLAAYGASSVTNCNCLLLLNQLLLGFGTRLRRISVLSPGFGGIFRNPGTALSLNLILSTHLQFWGKFSRPSMNRILQELSSTTLMPIASTPLAGLFLPVIPTS